MSKPVLTCIMAETDARKPIARSGERLPNYAFPESAARVLGKIAAYAEWRNQPEAMIPDFIDIQPRLARAVCRQQARIGRAGGSPRRKSTKSLRRSRCRSSAAAFAAPRTKPPKRAEDGFSHRGEAFLPKDCS